MQLLVLDNVVVGYQQPILPPINLTISAGDVLGILGPNGAGKSTLLSTMLGLLKPLAGRIVLPQGARPPMGYVPQAHRLDPAFPLSVLQVVLMGRYPRLGWGRRLSRADRTLALAQLEAVGMLNEAEHPFGGLSGGQRQRVLLARALAAEPTLLVLDEPTAELDPAAEHALLSLVTDLSRARRMAVVFVTHEISAAATFATTVALLNRHQQSCAVGAATALLTSAHLTQLYGRPVGIRREQGHVLVWINGQAGGGHE